MKYCSHCRENKSLNQFYRNKYCKNGYRPWCKQCDKDYNAQQYKDHNVDRKAYSKKHYELTKIRDRTYNIERHLVSRYGITIKQRQEMFNNQNGLCVICEKELENTTKANVDHDHETGKVRGLLCNNCNRGIGHLQHNIVFLQSAIKYLSSYSPLDKPHKFS